MSLSCIFFWHCDHTRKLWQDIYQFIVDYVYEDFELYFRDILFGSFSFEKRFNVCFLCNLIILLAKYFIHKCRNHEMLSHFFHFQEDVKIYITYCMYLPPVTKMTLQL